ncbi:MAG: GTPase Era [Alphaproteobacteria bacterium]|nr:GTPase Era [Alphaproteobacteria bacterium]MBQ6854212.1 GTPase Era [Alphaproteobacteria bacterium]
MTEETIHAPDINQQRFSFVAILGAPNAGKSTLVNQLTGAKVSIVSPKAQTTRSRIRGILVQDNTQLVLVDTPGIFKASRKFDRAMVASAWSESDESDMRLFVVDVQKGITREAASILAALKKNKQKAILVLNKIDLIAKDRLLPLIAELNMRGLFTETFLISAQTGENVAELKDYLVQQAPKGMWMFPSDQITDLPNRLFAAEITREKLFMNLQQELPYTVAVTTTNWEEKESGIRIEQTVFVERESLKPIVVGKNGSMIKKIGESARKELSYLLEQPVHLFLTVRVKENWANDPARYAEWGLDYNI